MSVLKGAKILLGPSTFAAKDPAPLDHLREEGAEIIDNPYKRRLTKEELMGLLTQGVTGLIAGLEPIDREVMEQSNLKVISRCGAGTSNVDLQAAKELGIKVCYTPYGPTTAVAELTVAALLDLLRSLSIMNHALHRGEWTKITGHQLEGKTVAIVGFGRIGRKLATLLIPFGVTVLAADVDTSDPMEGVEFCPLEDALRRADVVSLHVSGNEEIIRKKTFDQLKDGVILLNAARGEVINEEGLIEALEKGKVRGVWMDTFVDEPYSGPLRQYPQALLTPHVGSYTVEGRKKMEMDTVINLIEAFKESCDHVGY